jgi:protein gp37
MAERTGIGWTNATWNPVRGCERVSDGCKKCYAEELAARHSYPGGWGEGLAKWVTRPDGTREARWTGVIQTLDRMLDAPLKWREPRRIFVNSMSDLFHDDVPEDFFWRVLAITTLCPQHTFQVLTKRPERMLELVLKDERDALSKLCGALGSLLDGDWIWNQGKRFRSRIERAISATMGIDHDADNNEIQVDMMSWPLPNVWLGVSVENQDEADKRIPLLQQTPAAVHWLSCEPLLDHIEIGEAAAPSPGISWVVVGGESGQEPRPMQMEHARALIEQCKSAGVATFVKQDNGPRPGLQGRFTDEEWALKEYPA